MTKTTQKVTPMMAQWHACKKLAENAVLLFRMGDFYEAFYDDAELLARELGLTLTKRQEIPMSGVPVHTCEQYIDKLVAKGFRVAVAEQMEDPKQTKGLVRREIVRVVTPGSLVSSSLLADKANNFFASVHLVGKRYGLAYVDLSTGEFRAIEFDDDRKLLNELFRLRPAEYLLPKHFEEKHLEMFQELKQQGQFLVNTLDGWHFEWQTTYGNLLDHFQVQSLDGFGLKEMAAATQAAGALLAYLRDELTLPVQHIRALSTYSTDAFLNLDRTTQRNLELTENLKDGGRQHTLLEVLDHTLTPMGGRLLRHWIKQPLQALDAIAARQDAVEEFIAQRLRFDALQEKLAVVRDLERLSTRIATGYANARDLVNLRFSLEPLEDVKELLSQLESPLLQELYTAVDPLKDLAELIGAALVDEPPLRLGEGHSFHAGYNKDLDELQELAAGSKAFLAEYQARLRDELGIRTLKVGYTRVFGYYIEVSKAQSARMPDSFTRRQTLTNNERYISPKLKEFEEKILTAEDSILKIENELFTQLKEDVCRHVERIAASAAAIARVDCLCSLAEVARRFAYVRPVVDDSYDISIEEGRHPVIEAALLGERFIPNDTELNVKSDSLFVITGPNMAGKSTYIRQVALLTIMAHIGSFLPAKSARIGCVDRVFTRIGASDDLSRGQSTFMVEMTETANILHNVTPRSLVILDEIGRGTSTYDGISIAWAVAEHLLTQTKAKTLFATHYFELTQLEGRFDGAVNYNIAVRELEESIVFLRKIVKGDTDKSYGIHVARLAGIPNGVIKKAREVLVGLESKTADDSTPVLAQQPKSEVQFMMFGPKTEKRETSAVERALEELNINELTPLGALNALAELKEKLEEQA